MNKVKIFLMILIIGTMAQQAMATETSFFRPGRILISAEYQSLLPSCNSYDKLRYPQGLFEYCLSENFSLGLGLGYGSRVHPGYLRKQNEWSVESSAFLNFGKKIVRGILGVGLVWVPNMSTVKAKGTLGIRFIIAKNFAAHAKLLILKTTEMDFGVGFGYGLTFAFR